MKQPKTIIMLATHLAILLVLLIIVGWGCNKYGRYLGPPPPATCFKKRWKSNKTTATLKNGTLRISGKGAMMDYIYNFRSTRWAPWYGEPSEFSGGSCNLPITDVIIEEGITHIGNWAFARLRELKSVTISSSVTSIGEGAFAYCARLTSVTVAEDNAHYSSVDGVLFNKNKTELILYPAGRPGVYTIPSGVTTIGDRAFLGCNLTSVIIPNSVISIGEPVYMGCTECINLTSLPNWPRVNCDELGLGAFAYCKDLTSIVVAEDNAHYSSKDGILFNKTKDTLILYPPGRQGSYTIPSGVTAIGDRAFRFSAGLTSVIIPEGVKAIGGGAFAYCANLTSVTIPSSVTYIGGGAFVITKLFSVVSLNPVPPTIGCKEEEICFRAKQCFFDLENGGYYAFTILPQSSACLYVPEGSINAYRAAEGWNHFDCIKGLESVHNVSEREQYQ
jgi:hypothetical protein